MSDDFNSLLKQIESKKRNISIFIPSLNKEVEFLPLTVEQQSSIIDSVSDITILQNNPIYLILKFNNNFNEIIKKNIIDEDYQNITVIDRVNIIINFRNEISELIKNRETGDEINLKDVIERNSNFEFIYSEKNIENNGFKFKLTIPKLKDDSEVNKILSKKLKDNPESNNLISEIYLYELLKFVDSIQIDDNEEVFIDKNYRSLQLLKKIDLSTFKPVIEFIDEVRSLEEKYVTVEQGNKILLTPDLFVI